MTAHVSTNSRGLRCRLDGSAYPAESVERLIALYCVTPSKSCPEDVGRSTNCTRLRDTSIMRLPNNCNAPSETRNHSSIKRRRRCGNFYFRRGESPECPEVKNLFRPFSASA